MVKPFFCQLCSQNCASKYRTLTRFWLSLTRLVYLGCAILLNGQKKWLNQIKSLPISANHKQPSLIKGGQSYIGGGQKRVRAGYIPTEHPTYCLGFFWKHYKFLALWCQIIQSLKSNSKVLYASEHFSRRTLLLRLSAMSWQTHTLEWHQKLSCQLPTNIRRRRIEVAHTHKIFIDMRNSNPVSHQRKLIWSSNNSPKDRLSCQKKVYCTLCCIPNGYLRTLGWNFLALENWSVCSDTWVPLSLGKMTSPYKNFVVENEKPASLWVPFNLQYYCQVYF